MEVDSEFKYTVQNPSLHRARVIAERVLELYNKRELDEIYVIYTKNGKFCIYGYGKNAFASMLQRTV